MSSRQEYQAKYYASNKAAKQQTLDYEEKIMVLEAEKLAIRFELDIQMKKYEKLFEEKERLRLAIEYFAREQWQQM